MKIALRMPIGVNRLLRDRLPMPEGVLSTSMGANGQRGLVLRGTVWTGGDAAPFDGFVLIDCTGRVEKIAPATEALPRAVPVMGQAGSWIGPGIVDSHVHLSFSHPSEQLAAGVIGVRDLGAPPGSSKKWRTFARRSGMALGVCGPILTVAGGYPTRSWGADGYGQPIFDLAHAAAVVNDLVADGADVIKIALETGPGWPTLAPPMARAIVRAAHERGVAVVAHALTSQMVDRALRCGVDELAHVPTEALSAAQIEAIAEAGIRVSSTLQTFFSGGIGRPALQNATAMVEAGVPLMYGTDIGNVGTKPGVDPRELDRLAQAGLGRWGALRAATEGAAAAAGMRGVNGRIVVGEPAACVLLPVDPIAEPGSWRAIVAVVVGERIIVTTKVDRIGPS